jgi:hypothetical protein
VTTHFVFDVAGFDDYNGIPSSSQKVVRERYWRDGDDLWITLTVEDPMFLREPASYTTRWIPAREGYKLAPMTATPSRLVRWLSFSLLSTNSRWLNFPTARLTGAHVGN